LDLPRREVHGQVVLRTLRRIWRQERLWHGNVERWRNLFAPDSVIWWSIKTYARRRRHYEALFGDPRTADKARVRLHSRREVDRWLAALE
jgi:hypothetical protein